MKKIIVLTACFGIAACSEPTATPMDDAARTEQQQLDSAAEQLDQSNRQVTRDATKPRQ